MPMLPSEPVPAPPSSSLPSLSVLPTPLLLSGPVIRGFGRGSKTLGIPTANLDADALETALAGTPPGVYCGWACVGVAPTVVHKMVMSIGWCVGKGVGERDSEVGQGRRGSRG